MKWNRFWYSLFAIFFVLAKDARAVRPATWRQNEAADYEKAALIERLSLRSDGKLTLAPRTLQLLEGELTTVWALAVDSRGVVYAGGGGLPGRGAVVFRITPDGQSQLYVEMEGLFVSALAFDSKGRLYAATSPEGKVYRITGAQQAELFFAPPAKYVWALAVGPQDSLFVATGEPGQVFRVGPDGQAASFFRTPDAHVRSLAIDRAGTLVLGTEPNGLIYRVRGSGEGFVLYQTPRREVTAVAVGPDGYIYAAAVGNRQPATAPAAPPAPPPPVQPQAAQPTSPQPAQPSGTQTSPPPAPAPAMVPTATIPVSGGSEVYRVSPDGQALKIWSSSQEIVYSIAFDSNGSPLVATGNRGFVYRIESPVLFTSLVRLPRAQVTVLAAGPGGSIFAGTSNIGGVFRIGPEFEKEGVLESEVFDAEQISQWGRLAYRGEARGGVVRFETRSGNLDRPVSGWSPWAQVPLASNSGRIASPAARFLQYRLMLEVGKEGQSPEVDAIYIAYLPRNAAPIVDLLEVTPHNYRFQPQSLSLTSSRSITLPPLARGRRSSTPPAVTDTGSVTMQYEKGHVGVRWSASDPNGDELEFKVEIRGVSESEWKLVKDKVREKRLSWDSTAYADGWYVVRVTASDRPDNPPGEELEASLMSSPFLIDNTPPEISDLVAAREGSAFVVRWRARDASGLIYKAEYSVDGGEWSLVLPTTRISDSAEHDYLLRLTNLPPGEHTIAVRVSDDYDNQAVAKVVVR